MKKRILSFLFLIVLIISILPTYAFAGTLSNFTKVKTYQTNHFVDVPAAQWYADEVQLGYEYGLVNGKTATTYAPDSYLTIAEAIKLAAVLNCIYINGSCTLTNGAPWYQPYVDYALANGIISAAYPNYNANATRADFTKIFAKALPAEALTTMNTIEDNAIPDVSITYSYAPAVYMLYRAGILNGSGDNHAFKPNDPIKRSEVAAIAARMAVNDARVFFSLSAKALTPSEIYAKCASAVFYVDLLSKTGTSIGSASGFFISSDGLAVTNYHVIKDMISANITTEAGATYTMAGVVAYSEANDLAIIKINGTGFPYLELGNSDTALTGASIYAIGYPLGIDQTFTPGMITNASHPEDGINYIMMNASISPGSSGGALLDATGKVIGVTTAYYSNGQNLNLAVPINLLNGLSRTNTPVPLSTLFAKSYTYYTNYPSVPDFASVTGSVLADQEYTPEDAMTFLYYSTANLAEDIFAIADNYFSVLFTEGFTYFDMALYSALNMFLFYDPTNTYSVVVFVMDAENVAIRIGPVA